MKPGFALTLAHDGVALLQRSPRGWLSVGEVALDDPAFDSAVAGLRTTAQSLAPEAPLATKLVIPNSELLYTVIDVPGPDPEARRQAIRTALEGMTPYNVDELAFDWSGSGHSLHVAVVARETLSEAEEFASRHGFNPVSFVAQPEAGQFIGEPFFGETRCAAEVIGKSDKLERDLIPVQVVGRAERPSGQARTIFGSKLPFGGSMESVHPDDTPSARQTASEPPAPAPAASEPSVSDDRSSGPTQPPAPAAQGYAGDGPETDRARVAGPAQAAKSAQSRAGRDDSPAVPEAETAPEETAGNASDAQAARFVSRRQPTAVSSPDKAKSPEQPAAKPVPVDAESPDEAAERPAPAQPEHGAARPGNADKGTGAAKGDRRAPPPDTAKGGTRSRKEAATPATGTGLMSGIAGLATRARAAVSGSAAQAEKPNRPDHTGPAGVSAGAAGPKPAARRHDKAAAPSAEHDGASTPADIGARPSRSGTGKKAVGPGRSGGEPPRPAKIKGPELITPPKPRPTLTADSATNEAEAMTIFGARRHEQPGGGPMRLGLVIAAVLALAAGGAAVWAGYFLFTSERGDMPEIIASADHDGQDGAAGPADEGEATPAPAGDAEPQRAPDTTVAPTATDDTATVAPDASAPAEPSAEVDPLGDAPFNVDQAIADALDDVTADDVPSSQDGPEPDAPVGPVDGPASPGVGAPLDDPAPGIDSAPPLPASDSQDAPDAPQDTAEQIIAATPEAATPDPDSAAGSPDARPGQPPRELTRAEFEAAYEETGIWPFAPEVAALPRPGSLGDLRAPLADTAPPAQPPGRPDQDALRDDTVPDSPAPPAPFERTVPVADADAPAAAPAEPQPQVTLTTGAPPLSPPLRRDVRPRLQLHEGGLPIPENAAPSPRPAGISPEAGDQQGALGASDSTEDAGVTIQRAALAPLRPASRPAQAQTPDTAAATPEEEAAPVAALATADAQAPRPAASPLTGAAPAAVEVRRASLAADATRPAPRPAGEAQAGTLAMQEPRPPAQELQVALATPESETPRPRARLGAGDGAPPPQETTEAGEAPVSELVVARSPQPGVRPSGLAARAAQLQASQGSSAPDAPAQQTTREQSPARSAAAAAPSIPTSASVARQATVEGAINLRRLNLIGVFGTDSDRRALVRMSNGQVVSVRVGDRLDGGQVAAIGESELRYIKNGRNNVLRVGES